MSLINDDDAVLPQQEVMLHLSKQDTIRHKLQCAILSHLPVMSDLHMHIQKLSCKQLTEEHPEEALECHDNQ